jgi:predicted RNA-binding protein YlxR (DUF448 family)
VPDERRRLPGRGAHLHRDPACLALAERRRALPRALRATAPLDLAALHEWFAQLPAADPSREAGPATRR